MATEGEKAAATTEATKEVDTKKNAEQAKADRWKSSTRVDVCVGGKSFSTTRETLLKAKDSFFHTLLESGNFKPDEKGVWFIDRNPKYFEIIIEFLRTGELFTKYLSDEQLKALKIEIDWYDIQISGRSQSHLLGSQLLGNHYELLTEWLEGRKIGSILYRASEFGFSGTEFHSKCDNQGPTLVLIRATGYLFGGFAASPWSSTTGVVNNPKSFLFTLTNPHNIKPTKFTCKNPIYAQGNNPLGGPAFGGGDIYISPQSHSDSTSCTNFPTSYNDTTGKGDKLFTGAKSFKTQDIEVFKVID